MLIVKDTDKGDPALTKWCLGFDSRLVVGPPRVSVTMCSQSSGTSKAGCVICQVCGTLHIKDAVPLFEMSRVVIQVAVFP